MRNLIIIFTSIILGVASQLNAQTVEWERTWGGSSENFSYSVQQTFDGGFVFAGNTSLEQDSIGIWLLKTSNDGDIIWTKLYKIGNIVSLVNSVVQTSDSGFIMTGFADDYAFSADSAYVWLLKTDLMGNRIWSKTIGGSRSGKGYNVKQTSDGGYIIIGSKYIDNEDIWLIKTDDAGETLWTRSMDFNSQNNRGHDILQASDGGFLLITEIDSSVIDCHNIIRLIKTDSTGNTVWTRVYSGRGFSGDNVWDGGFIISGCTGQSGQLIRTDSLGIAAWTRNFEGGTIYSVQQTTDRGFILGGNDRLIRTDSLGNTLWTKTFSGNIYSVLQADDKSYVFAGQKDGDAWLAKIVVKPVPFITVDPVWKDIDDDGFADGVLDGSASFQIENVQIILYQWFNGIVEIGTGSNVNVSLPRGENNIKLIVIDENGRADSTEITISVILGDLPIPVITAESAWKDIDDDGFAQGTLDASNSTHPAGYNITGFEWSLNDSVLGTTAQITASLPTGTNSVKLIVTDENGLSNFTTQDITVTLGELPTPVITAESQWKDIDDDGFAQGILDASSSSHPAGYANTGFEWTLNESILGTTAQITVFLPIGTNTVKLTVTDENGLSNTTTKSISVVLSELPIPAISAEDLWTDTDENGSGSGTLDGSSSSHPAGFTIVDYKWRFKGANIANGNVVNVSLPTGTNRVYLVVTDENGLVDSTSTDINVHAQFIQTDGPISSAVSSIGDTLFFSSSADDKVYYYDRSGEVIGTIRTGGAIRSTTTVGPNNIMYVGSSDTRLYAFDINGNFVWDLPMGDLINASPAVTLQDILYVGVDNGRLFSLNGVDGVINWNYQTDGPINSSASISDSGVVYFGSDDGKLYALNADGTLKWSYATGGAVQSSPALDTLGNIYFGSDDGNLYAVNPSGTQLWSYNTAGEINSSPVIGADGTVYFGSADSSVYAVSSSGLLVWSYKSDSPVNGTGALSFNGILYIGSDNGKLLALSPTGEMLWYYQTNGTITAPPLITADNMIYVGSADGAIYGMVDPNLLGLSKGTIVENPGQWPTFQQNNQRTGQRAGDVFGPILSVALLVNPIIGSYYDLYVFSDEALQATPIVKLNDTDIEMTLESQVGDHVYHSSVHLTQIGMNAVSVTAIDLVGNESEFESSFTFGKLAFNATNQIRHNDLGITFMIPGNHLMREGNLLLSSLELTDNMSQLKKVYPSLDFTAKRSDGEIFIIETNAIFSKEYKLSYNPKDNSAVTFFRLTSSGWQSLTTYTDESHSTVWAYSGEPGIYGIFEGGELTKVPTEFNLSDAFPNPFNLSTTIRYVVPVQGDFKEANSSRVDLDIYNIRGQLVKKVVSRAQTPGTYEVTWNGTNESGRVAATGIYLMRLSVGDNITTKKLTLLK